MSFGKWLWEISLLVVSVWSDKTDHSQPSLIQLKIPSNRTNFRNNSTLTSLSYKGVKTDMFEIGISEWFCHLIPASIFNQGSFGSMPMLWFYFCICFCISRIWLGLTIKNLLPCKERCEILAATSDWNIALSIFTVPLSRNSCRQGFVVQARMTRQRLALDLKMTYHNLSISQPIQHTHTFPLR